MEQVTLKDFLIMKGYSLTMLADELGLSMALLSRIKNGSANITTSTKAIFKERFPGYELKTTNDNASWREMFLQQAKEATRLKERVATLERENEDLKNVINLIKKLVD